MADAIIRKAEKTDLPAILDVYAQDDLSTWSRPTSPSPIAEAFDEIVDYLASDGSQLGHGVVVAPGRALT
jgi:hypothetical protein